MEERLQKIIAAAGIASRRAAEQLILDGHVRVNGKVVTELGSRADAAKDHIKVSGKLINPRQPHVYIMLNKPAGYVTTVSDPEGRPTVLDLLKGLKIRVYPVGRLDFNTEGLLILTNDGDFAHLVTHPKHELPKTYRAKVKGVLEDKRIEELEQGVYLDDGRTAPARVRKMGKEEVNSWVEITIHEGRKRQVRRMFDRVGHSVIKLKRVKVGALALGELAEGAFRYLNAEEVAALKQLSADVSRRGVPSEKKASFSPPAYRRAAGRNPEREQRQSQRRGPGSEVRTRKYQPRRPDHRSAQKMRKDSPTNGQKRAVPGFTAEPHPGSRRSAADGVRKQVRRVRVEARSQDRTERRSRFGTTGKKPRSLHTNRSSKK